MESEDDLCMQTKSNTKNMTFSSKMQATKIDFNTKPPQAMKSLAPLQHNLVAGVATLCSEEMKAEFKISNL